uniref:Uncharacterized protein n=1 Tax=Rhizophora mucronata TaxID=61149 RepID=A0A2P2QS96_RHIMU
MPQVYSQERHLFIFYS